MYLYNLPDLTGNDIQAETVQKLSQRSNIVGIKNTMPTTFRLFKLLSICPPDFDIISGDDMGCVRRTCLGGCGASKRIAEMLNFDFKPSAIKAMLELRGFKKTCARAPLQCSCGEEEYAGYREILKDIFKDTDLFRWR